MAETEVAEAEVAETDVAETYQEPMSTSNPVQCPFCDDELDSSEALNTHLQIDHDAREESAVEIVRTTKQIQEQSKLHLTVNCEKCDFEFINEKDLNDHITAEHGLNTVEIHEFEESHFQYACDQCDSVFSNTYCLNVHIKMSHSGQLKCSMCTYTFRTQDEVELHEVNAHSSWEKGSVGDMSSFNISNNYEYSRKKLNFSDLRTDEWGNSLESDESDEEYTKDEYNDTNSESEEESKGNEVSDTALLLTDDFSCESCKKKITRKANLNRYVHNIHNKPIKRKHDEEVSTVESQQSKKTKISFKCDVCAKNFHLHLTYVVMNVIYKKEMFKK